jgi:hypothetical protein
MCRKHRVRSDDLLCWQRRFGPLRPFTAPSAAWYVEGIGCTTLIAPDCRDLSPAGVPLRTESLPAADHSDTEFATTAHNHVAPFAMDSAAHEREVECLQHAGNQGACMQHATAVLGPSALQLRTLRERAQAEVCHAALDAKHGRQQARLPQCLQTHHAARAPPGQGTLARPGTCPHTHDQSGSASAQNNLVDAAVPLSPWGPHSPVGSNAVNGRASEKQSDSLVHARARCSSPSNGVCKGKHARKSQRPRRGLALPATGQRVLAEIVLGRDRFPQPHCARHVRGDFATESARVPAILWTSRLRGAWH